MKFKFLLIAVTLMNAATVLAKGGNGGANDILTRGTSAWFAVESVEHEVRSKVATGTLAQDALVAAEVELTAADRSKVQLSTQAQTMQDTCIMYDESSHHGTVWKKDVRCAQVPYYADKFELTRGTEAWAVVEAMEKSTRLAVVGDTAILESVAAASSKLQTNRSVNVSLVLKSGKEVNFACAREYYGVFDPNSLNCVQLP